VVYSLPKVFRMAYRRRNLFGDMGGERAVGAVSATPRGWLAPLARVELPPTSTLGDELEHVLSGSAAVALLKASRRWRFLAGVSFAEGLVARSNRLNRAA
jgi:hypothetical protein